ncbi:T9SS type A sorting domain-containing protein [Lacinutrix sp. WUR7]|uniref:T9SS type A sorting domain-containing protein n=1 Tax=Lacinutrix sp. WUR7 TaxID=2653681 RepID=UPI00193E389E|nr:T9SS type A sorting domain-containing protein [Lacinutrix sp. WUR7]QRM88075.1 T9SS type A sorting domain-containing protein [Lacinutrix sp. WUR7]
MFKLTLFPILLLALLCPIYIFSQSGPGGVGNTSTNGLWLKVDDLKLLDGEVVSNWRDASGNNNDANQTITGEQPSFISNSSLNNYPSVDFNGVRDWLKVDDADILDGTTAITYFSVFKPKGLYTSNNVHAILGKRLTYSVSANYAYTFFLYNNKLTTDIVNSNNRYTSSASFSNDENYILSFDFDGSNPINSRSSMSRNGSVLLTAKENSTSIINSNQPLTIGTMNVDYNRYSKGEMSELIHFNYKLNQAETIIVNNYLSAKYNIALTANNFYTNDNIANGDFDHHVAGIGQASDGSNHLDSQGSGIVRINAPSALSNGDYLFWGEDKKDPSYNFVTETVHYREQLDSKWRVSKIGNLGTVNMSFDISALDLTAKQSCQPLQLIVDSNSAFSTATSYDLTISGSTATVSGVSFSDGDYFTLSYLDQIVWDGTSYFNGSGIGSAPNASDSCLKLTVKSGAIGILNEAGYVREVQVELGATLQVNDGVLLEVENGIWNNGTITFVDEAQLIQKHTGTSLNSGSGDLTISQEGSNNLYNYNYWSAPVHRNGNWQVNYLETETGPIGFTSSNDANPLASPMEWSNRWLYTFNGLADAYADWHDISPTTPITPGLGYTMKGSGNLSVLEQKYTFKGIANDGDIFIDVLAGDEVLVGNPFPSALDAVQFIKDNLSVIDGSLYFYEQFASNDTHVLNQYQGGYATYNLLGAVSVPIPVNGGVSSKGGPKDYIPVGQSFFVKAHTDGTIVFKNSQRAFKKESLGESVFYRTSEETTTDTRIKYWLAFRDAASNESTIALGYDTNANAGFNHGYDSRTFNELSNEIYWAITDEELCIQALNSFDVLDEIPLGIHITDSGAYTFEITETLNFPESETIYLKDNQTNMFYDIMDNGITLNLNSSVDVSRFSIVYQEGQVLSSQDLDANPVSVFYNIEKETLVLHGIENLNEIQSLNIYNLLGQNIQSLNNVNSENVDLSFLNSGMYIAEITDRSNKKIKLKFVKR